jgi:diacylglycerol kinase family enzyme
VAGKASTVVQQGHEQAGSRAGSHGAGRRRRWAARLALAAVLALIALLVVSGAVASISALVIGLAGLAVMCAATWAYAVHHGVRRWLALAVLIAVPIAIVAVYVVAGLLVEIILCTVLAGIAVAAARAAGPGGDRSSRTSERPARAARQPYLIMNPRSGGGKVERFGLRERAVALGAEVESLSGPEHVDVAELAGDAVDGGADLLGVAGGDGTQALVAGVASARGVPLLVIAAGTRNHFAMDLGLDRDDPARCLDALDDGVELRVDLGLIGGRPFVNNASFGVYAEIVQSPAYREDKTGTTLRMLPDLVTGHRGPRLEVRVDGRVVLSAPQAVLVSNNAYEAGDIAGLARRARLDEGVLGVVGVGVSSAAQAAALLTRRGQERCMTRYTAREVEVDADAPAIPVGIDGESVLMPTPVRCSILPGALRVVVPRIRPGVPEPHGPADWAGTVREALNLPWRRQRP